MTHWHWYQWVFASFYAISMASLFYRFGAQKGTDAPNKFDLILAPLIQAGLIYALHRGGFW
jgi:hypothetical protein